MKSSRILLLTMAVMVLSAIPLLVMASPVYAINLPDTPPAVISKYVYRNVLESNDFLVIVYENTPYATTPDVDYSEAFIWRFIDTDGTTELAKSLGYSYFESGYGYNIISFYFDNVTAPSWGLNYFLTLSGTPVAFASPPEYTFPITPGDFSALTGTDAVKADIADKIILTAQDLDVKWALPTDYLLILEIETGTVLSIYGESFFRGAIYGCQAFAPAAFRLMVNNVNTADRSWSANYTVGLENQYSGTYIDPALKAGKHALGVSYNLFGMIGVLIICAVVLVANWVLSGGNIWKGLVEASSPLVIGGRLALFGLGELGLVAAICWLYISAKIWKII